MIKNFTNLLFYFNLFSNILIFIRCRICQNVIKANYITIMKHLKCVHNVSFKDYKKKFNIFIGKVTLEIFKIHSFSFINIILTYCFYNVNFLICLKIFFINSRCITAVSKNLFPGHFTPKIRSLTKQGSFSICISCFLA